MRCCQPTIVAARIEAGLQRVQERRTVVAALHVVLARPHELDRDVALVGARERDERSHAPRPRSRTCGFARRPKLPPANSMLIFTCSGLMPSVFAIAIWSPVWNCSPFQTSHAVVAREPHHAVHRLHRRVREVRKLVRRLERLRGAGDRLRGVAVVARGACRAARRACGSRHDLRARALEGAAVVPLDLQRVAALASPTRSSSRAPRRRSGSRRRSARRECSFNASASKLVDVRAEARRMRDDRGQHVRQLHVLREASRCR